MAGAQLTDADYLDSIGRHDVDEYAFSERVGLILDNEADNPTPEKLSEARRISLETTN